MRLDPSQLVRDEPARHRPDDQTLALALGHYVISGALCLGQSTGATYTTEFRILSEPDRDSAAAGLLLLSMQHDLFSVLLIDLFLHLHDLLSIDESRHERVVNRRIYLILGRPELGQIFLISFLGLFQDQFQQRLQLGVVIIQHFILLALLPCPGRGDPQRSVVCFHALLLRDTLRGRPCSLL